MLEGVNLTIGIDATNACGDGDVKHLVELLEAAQSSELCVERVVVWGGTPTLKALDPWLDKHNPPTLD